MSLLMLTLLACEPTADAPFQGGMFQLTTEGVTDECYDNAMNVVFMPEGTPNDFANLTELPGVDAAALALLAEVPMENLSLSHCQSRI